MAKVSCVLFDIGGVIIDWHNSWLIDEVSNTFGISRNDLTREFTNNLPELSSGKINEKEFWNNIAGQIGCSKLANQHSLFGKIFRKYATVNESMITVSRKLKENGMRLGILSNTESVTYSIIEELTSLDHFEFKFLSYEIGYTKPDSRIYQYVIDNIPFDKEELFFIDDLMSNVKSAQRSGIKAIQFSNYKKLFDELRKEEILG